jgi:hypothetical protein
MKVPRNLRVPQNTVRAPRGIMEKIYNYFEITQEVTNVPSKITRIFVQQLEISCANNSLLIFFFFYFHR